MFEYRTCSYVPAWAHVSLCPGNVGPGSRGCSWVVCDKMNLLKFLSFKVPIWFLWSPPAPPAAPAGGWEGTPGCSVKECCHICPGKLFYYGKYSKDASPEFGWNWPFRQNWCPHTILVICGAFYNFVLLYSIWMKKTYPYVENIKFFDFYSDYFNCFRVAKRDR